MHGLTAGMHVLSKLPLHLFTCVSTDLASLLSFFSEIKLSVVIILSYVSIML